MGFFTPFVSFSIGSQIVLDGGDSKEHKFHLTGRSLWSERPGESPGNPVWSSRQITHSGLGCGDSSADKMADILFPSFLPTIEFLPLLHHFLTLNVPQLRACMEYSRSCQAYKDFDQLVWLCSFVKQILQPGARAAPRV